MFKSIHTFIYIYKRNICGGIKKFKKKLINLVIFVFMFTMTNNAMEVKKKWKKFFFRCLIIFWECKNVWNDHLKKHYWCYECGDKKYYYWWCNYVNFI